MSSPRLLAGLEFANHLEHATSPLYTLEPFGGKQFILVGDFFHLKFLE